MKYHNYQKILIIYEEIVFQNTLFTWYYLVDRNYEENVLK